MWDNVFNNGPSKICGSQPLKNVNRQYHIKFLKGYLPQIWLASVLKTLLIWIWQYQRIDLMHYFIKMLWSSCHHSLLSFKPKYNRWIWVHIFSICLYNNLKNVLKKGRREVIFYPVLILIYNNSLVTNV